MTLPYLAFLSLGTGEIIIIAVLLLILFGSQRLPALGRGLGRTAAEIKNLFKGKDQGPKDE